MIFGFVDLWLSQGSFLRLCKQLIKIFLNIDRSGISELLIIFGDRQEQSRDTREEDKMYF